MDEYSQGVCHDGAAILCNGVMLTVDEIVERLNRLATLEAEKEARERQEPVAFRWLGPGKGWRPVYAHPLALREPTEDECREIWRAIRRTTATDQVSGGRAMWQAVREVMTK